MEISPDELEWRDNYKLLTGAIVPRPIGFVSTVSQSGIRNLAAFSFFNGVCPKPLVISFAPMNRSGGEKKDTLRNIEETRQFVVNVVTEDIVLKMNETAPEFPPDVDEFAVSGLTPAPSAIVKPPRVLESPINMECELLQVIQISELPGSGSLVLGKVVHMHIADELYFDGKIDGQMLKPVARLAGDEYCKVTHRFQLKRPKLKT